MTHSADWHERRRTGVTGSDIVSLAGLSRFKTNLDIYNSKAHPELVIEDEPSEKMRLGTILEPVIAREFCARHGYALNTQETFVRHPQYDFVIGNVDGFLIDSNGNSSLLEVKTTSGANALGFGKEGTDEVPDYYKLQVMWYLFATGLERCELAILIAGQKIARYVIEYDHKLAEQLFKIARHFWEYNVALKIPPQVISADLSVVFPVSNKTAAICEPEHVTLAREYLEAKKMVAFYQAQVDEIGNKLKSYMGENAELRTPEGDLVATWKNVNRSDQFSATKLKNEDPETYKRYLVSATGYRTFLVKGVAYE